MRTIFTTLAIALLNFYTWGDKQTIDSFNKHLIENGKKGKLLKQPQGMDELYQGKYLGQITAKKRTYHIVAFTRIFNLKNSPTAESHIFLYDKSLNYMGNYYLTLIDELPSYIIGQKLYFLNTICDRHLIVDFKKGIPPAINLKCNGENAYYEFHK